jgi:hypothetical protein
MLSLSGEDLASIPTVPLLDAQAMKNVEFPNADVMVATMQVSAMRLGFGLCLTTSRMHTYPRFYCHMGSKKVIPDVYSPKCRCFFRFRNTGGPVALTTSICDHNHPLAPDAYVYRTLVENQKKHITNLYSAGLYPTRIQRILFLEGLILNTTQIGTIVRAERTHGFIYEAQDLINWLGTIDGAEWKVMKERVDQTE